MKAAEGIRTLDLLHGKQPPDVAPVDETAFPSHRCGFANAPQATGATHEADRHVPLMYLGELA